MSRPSGSANTEAASSNVTWCSARLAAAFGPYHSNLDGSVNYLGSWFPDVHNAAVQRAGATAAVCMKAKPRRAGAGATACSTAPTPERDLSHSTSACKTHPEDHVARDDQRHEERGQQAQGQPQECRH